VFGPGAPQSTSNAGDDPVFDALPASEDCLTLNVWTPTVGKAGLPVIVYIHGGGFLAMSGAEPLWHGDAFARDGVVLVTVNYRLGALGFLHLDDVLGGAEDTSANGLLDQIAALRWVQDNIAAFGGDPARVTVMGESAGGWSVSTLIASPLARGLFSRAIIQSGGGNHGFLRETAARITERFLDFSGLARNLAALREAPAERILAGQLEIQRIVGGGGQETADLLGDDAHQVKSFLPVIGSQLMPELPQAAVAAGAGAGIDLLAASCRDEYGMRRAFGLDAVFTEERMLRNLRVAMTKAGKPTEPLAALYKSNRPRIDSALIAEAFAGDYFFRIPVLRMAEGHSGGRGRTYFCEFAYSDSAFGAGHMSELPLVFAAADSAVARLYMPSGAPEQLVEAAHRAWVTFAESGRAEVKGMPAWPEYDETTRQTMIFDHPECHVVSDPRAPEREIWQGIV
jgi:para-nitrobenzyl esterase